MPDQTPPPPLDYRPPPAPAKGQNRWWQVGLRVVGGCVLSAASITAGVFLSYATRFGLFTLLMPLGMLGVLIFVSIRFRRFGYVTGFVVAPFIIFGALAILLWTICGWGGR